MGHLFRAEMRKVGATPVTWWLLVSTVAVGVLGTIAPLIAADGESTDLLSDHRIREALHGAAGGAILVLVAGVIGMAGEWRFGQASQVFLSTPRRSRVVGVKTVVYLGLGALYGLVAALAATATAWGWYRARGLALPLERSAVWLTLIGCVAVAALFGVIGVAVGAIVRRPVPALVGALTWTVLVEPALFAAAPSVFRWLPGVASLSLRRQPAEHLLPVGSACAVLLGLVTVALVVGVRQVERDDVTG